ncbi:MAG TPA: 2-dehydropantoate 2-reductase, partial [Chloroflexota bacterium]|nr:2-dehydropantoate 2-reductase [Chloroflexota bacterium]
VGEGTAVISFQNGVENEDVLATVLGSTHVLGGLAYVTSTIASPGVIEQRGETARIVFGELDGRESPRAQGFLAACRGAGINAELSRDIAGAIWTKFLYICAFSGVCTLTRQPLGPVLADPDTRDLFVTCMNEVAAVARARGVRLADDVVSRQLALADSYGAALKPSMLVDLERGNRLEAEWLNGAVARLGRQAGVEAPVNRFIFTALKLLAEGQSPPPAAT